MPYVIQDTETSKLVERLPYAGIRVTGTLENLSNLLVFSTKESAQHFLEHYIHTNDLVIRLLNIELGPTVQELFNLQVRESMCDVEDYGK
jgi:hypothetical protein